MIVKKGVSKGNAEESVCVECGRRGIASLRAPDAVLPRQCPTKKNRLAIATLRAPDSRFAQSNTVVIRSQFYAPTLRCRYVATTRLVANNDYVTAPSLRPRRGFAAFAKCFRLDTASSPAYPGSDVATMQHLAVHIIDIVKTRCCGILFIGLSSADSFSISRFWTNCCYVKY